MAAGVPIQTVSEAAHMRLIDLQSTELPTSIQLETLIFTDQTNPANTGTHVEGILDWTTTGPDYPKVYEDWALADEFEVFLAEAGSLSGTLSRSLGTVTIGTAAGVTTWQLTIPETLLSGANALVVKAKKLRWSGPSKRSAERGLFAANHYLHFSHQHNDGPIFPGGHVSHLFG